MPAVDTNVSFICSEHGGGRSAQFVLKVGSPAPQEFHPALSHLQSEGVKNMLVIWKTTRWFMLLCVYTPTIKKSADDHSNSYDSFKVNDSSLNCLFLPLPELQWEEGSHSSKFEYNICSLGIPPTYHPVKEIHPENCINRSNNICISPTVVAPTHGK